MRFSFSNIFEAVASREGLGFTATLQSSIVRPLQMSFSIRAGQSVTDDERDRQATPADLDQADGGAPPQTA